jgi:hypothetical protein
MASHVLVLVGVLMGVSLPGVVNATQVADAEYEAMEGDARNVLCDAVERHHAEMLVVGSHGYGAIKRSLFLCLYSAFSSLVSAPKPEAPVYQQRRNGTQHLKLISDQPKFVPFPVPIYIPQGNNLVSRLVKIAPSATHCIS